MTDFEIFIRHNNLKKSKIAQYMGVSNAFITQLVNGNRGIPNDKLLKIIANTEWDTSMFSGVTSLSAPSTSSSNEEINAISTGKIIPYYDAEVAAGTTYGMEMTQVRPSGMIEIGGLMKDSEFALRVYGNSMVPNYPAGCVIGLRQYTERFIEPGTVYVVETSENRYLKRLYYNKDKSAFRCLSDNHMKHESGPMTGEYFYPEFEIPFEDVRRLLRVTGVIKRNIM